jgi:hypothetical protein
LQENGFSPVCNWETKHSHPTFTVSRTASDQVRSAQKKGKDASLFSIYCTKGSRIYQTIGVSTWGV